MSIQDNSNYVTKLLSNLQKILYKKLIKQYIQEVKLKYVQDKSWISKL